MEGGGFVSRFRRETGFPIRILSPDLSTEWEAGSVDWDLRWGGERLLSVSLEELGPQDYWAPRIRFWVRAVTLTVLLAWGFMVLGGRGLPGHRVAAPVALLFAAILIPSSGLWPGGQLASPSQFLLPPFGGNLGQLLEVLMALALLCGLFPLGGSGRVGPAMSAALVTLGFPVLDLWFKQAPSPALLSGGPGGSVPYQAALALALTLVAYLALGRGGGAKKPLRDRAGYCRPEWLWPWLWLFWVD